MYFKSVFFDGYKLGSKRITLGRTITETDLVVHAGHTGDFFRITWMLNGVKRNLLNKGLRMEQWFLALELV